jgi:hypothetical protein
MSRILAEPGVTNQEGRAVKGHKTGRKLTCYAEKANKSYACKVIGGQGWIRTSVRKTGQIYSLLPLTTRPPVHIFARGIM